MRLQACLKGSLILLQNIFCKTCPLMKINFSPPTLFEPFLRHCRDIFPLRLPSNHKSPLLRGCKPAQTTSLAHVCIVQQPTQRTRPSHSLVPRPTSQLRMDTSPPTRVVYSIRSCNVGLGTRLAITLASFKVE